MSEAAPVRRLFLEGIVIVVSVLLAFGIDAAWDESRERAEFASLVDLLSADMERNLGALQTNKELLDRQVPRLQALLGVIDGSIRRPSDDSLRVLISGTLNQPAFKPIRAAYDAASTSSGWERMPAETQVSIARFVGESTNAQTLAFALDQFPRLVEILGRHGGLQAFVPPSSLDAIGIARPTRRPPDFDALLADQDFENEVVMYLVGQVGNRRIFAFWIEEVTRIRDSLAAF